MTKKVVLTFKEGDDKKDRWKIEGRFGASLAAVREGASLRLASAQCASIRHKLKT